MVLSNAERQRRFRQRFKARANGIDLGQMALEAVDAGFAAVWAIYTRPSADGSQWGDIDGMSNVSDLMRVYRGQTAEGLAMFEDWLVPEEETHISGEERTAIERAVAVYQAALLKHVPAAEKVKPDRKVGKARDAGRR